MTADEQTTRADLVSLSRRHVWPPYTSPERHESADPLVIVDADGSWLIDADGRRYLDGISSWWACTLGHRHPRLVRALVDQLQHLDHVGAGGAIHPAVARLAAELVAVAPAGLTRVHFSDDGSTAVEVAVKIAFQYWQQSGRPGRRRFLTLGGAYHGDTLGAASLAGVTEFFGVFAPLLFDVLRAPADGVWDETLARVEQLAHAHADELAGVVVEPLLQGAGGMRFMPVDALRRLREITRDIDTFMIADEVFTGYGRTGTMWACDQAQISPDLLCVAKGFTGGVTPMAATLATERIYDGFRARPGHPNRALMHGHTFCGHPLGAAVAREVLSIYRDEHILDGIVSRAAAIARCIEGLRAVPGVARARSLGMVGAVDLGSSGYLGAAGPRFYEAALRRGLYLRPLGDTVYLCPPFTISEADLAQLLDGFAGAVTDALS
ncbi:MAG: adenosylmethionine--8-amino-7-oxononanoate transaminase [Kofleriaceae bacterium]